RQFQAVELPLARDVRDRLAGMAAREKPPRKMRLGFVRRLVRVSDQPGARPRRGGFQQYFRLQFRQAAAAQQLTIAFPHAPAQAAISSPSAASCSAWYSADRASISSSRSPSMMSAIL